MRYQPRRSLCCEATSLKQSKLTDLPTWIARVGQLLQSGVCAHWPVQWEQEKPATRAAGLLYYWPYAAFFCWFALTCAHLARCALAILRRAWTDRVRFTGALLTATGADGDLLRAFAHLAFCARAIRLRATADTRRFGWAPLREDVELLRPMTPSSAVMALFNFWICNCACLRSSRSWLSTLTRSAIVPPEMWNSASDCNGTDGSAGGSDGSEAIVGIIGRPSLNERYFNSWGLSCRFPYLVEFGSVRERAFRVRQRSSTNDPPHPHKNSQPTIENIDLSIPNTGAARTPHMRVARPVMPKNHPLYEPTFSWESLHLENREHRDLCGERGTAVEHNVAQRARSGVQKALMPLIEHWDKRRAQERNCSPLQAPSRAQPGKSGTPRAKQKNTQCEVANKVSGLT